MAIIRLKNDPTEQKNLIADKKYAVVLANIKKELLRLRDHYDDHEKAGDLK